MSRSAKVRRFFGDSDYDFALRIGECEELEEAFSAGLVPMLSRVSEVRTREIKAVLRLGLIGGGMDKEPAAKLVERHVEPAYLAECSVLASEVLSAVIAGALEEPLGEPKGSETSDLRSPTGSFDTPTSTAPAARSGFPRKRSAKARSGS
jgi:hypothetical protein